MDKRNLFFRHAPADQFCFDIIIYIEGAVAFRRGLIAEDNLCPFVGGCILSSLHRLLHTGMDFASGIIRQPRLAQALLPR